MDHKEQTPEEQRINGLVLSIEAYNTDYFDGKLSGQEWLTLVVDAVQSHQAEALTESKVQG